MLKFHKNIGIFPLNSNFALANSVDPDEMQQHAAYHVGLHCLPKYPF